MATRSNHGKDNNNLTKEAPLAGGGALFDGAKFLQICDAVAQITTPDQEGVPVGFFGTAIYVKLGEFKCNFLLTCQHVPTNDFSIAKFKYQGDANHIEIKIGSFKELISSHEDLNDYKLLVVNKKVTATLANNGIEPIEIDDNEENDLPKIDDIVVVIQHPLGRPKKISYEKIMYVDEYKIGYNADTDFGSSGSAVIFHDTLLALHQETNNLRKANQGMLISNIVKEISEAKQPCNRSELSSPMKLKKCEGFFITPKEEKEGRFVCNECQSAYEGQILDGKFHGVGRLQFKRQINSGKSSTIEHVFEGQWKNGWPHGHCVKTITLLPNRILFSYNGNFMENVKHGHGVIETYCYKYDGEFANNRFKGGGELAVLRANVSETFPWKSLFRFFVSTSEAVKFGKNLIGRIYTGKFDHFSGKGSISFPNGDFFVGEWSFNFTMTRGKLTYADNSVYEGNFGEFNTFHEQRHGFGVFISADGSTTYKGRWKKGKRHGQGRETKNVGGRDVTRVGEWSNGSFVETACVVM